MILLSVDIGNTSTTFGLFENDNLTLRFHFLTRTLTHSALTREALHTPLLNTPSPHIIGIASVVPWASDELIGVMHELYPTATILVVTASNMSLRIDYPNPDELGTDRLLGALAAFKQWGEAARRPCIVVDLGTATTYDCVTKEGVYLGGAIGPGLELGAEALAQRAAQLPSIELAFPASIIGRTTVESIQSGILFGGIAQLEGMVGRFQSFAFPGEEPIVVLTGGLSRLLEGQTSIVSYYAPDLILEGIRIASEIIAQETIEQLP